MYNTTYNINIYIYIYICLSLSLSLSGRGALLLRARREQTDEAALERAKTVNWVALLV